MNFILIHFATCETLFLICQTGCVYICSLVLEHCENKALLNVNAGPIHIDFLQAKLRGVHIKLKDWQLTNSFVDWLSMCEPPGARWGNQTMHWCQHEVMKPLILATKGSCSAHIYPNDFILVLKQLQKNFLRILKSCHTPCLGLINILNSDSNTAVSHVELMPITWIPLFYHNIY